MPLLDIVKRRVAEGILAFPATPFKPDDTLDLARFETHLAELAEFRPAAMVVAGGAGELFSLSPSEHRDLIANAAAASGDVPVIAGVGFGVAIARELARAAEDARAVALLVFPPYLILSEQDGLARYIEAICGAVSIGVIVYNRGNGVLTTDTVLRLAERCPNLIAIKDGIGDFEALTTLVQRTGDRLAVINGVPTAEMIAAQCHTLGIRSYTSAVFTFLPALASHFSRALREGDKASADRMLREFYIPLSAIRKRRHGYAVSIIKAGLRLVGQSAGHVRAPLTELTEADERDLAALVSHAAVLTDEIHAAPARAAS